MCRFIGFAQVRKEWGPIMLLAGLFVTQRADVALALPNIVYVLADDLGFGDVRSYNATSPVNTPNIDRIATAGMRFTDAHSSDSVCTPTRYSVLTGQYSWRGAFTTGGVLAPFAAPIISPTKLTVAEMLKSSGYDTAAFGKWHLGSNWVTTGGGVHANGDNVNFSVPFGGGPVDRGFDTFFGVEGSPNYPPYAFIRDRQAVSSSDLTTPVIPTGQVNGNPTNSANWFGPIAPGYDITNLLPAITNQATAYISSKAGGPNPFFTYIPLNGVHEPILPPSSFAGTTGKGAYGDFIATVDWAMGKVLDTLNDPNHDTDTSDSILNNTLVIFSSDNGAGINLGFPTSAGKVNGVSIRDDKASIYEGGHRIPFLAQWPGHIPAGTVNNHIVEENDFMATVASIVGYSLPSDAAEDSVNISSELLGTSPIPSRSFGIARSTDRSVALRQVDSGGTEWKLIFTNGNGDGVGIRFDPMATLTDFTKVQLYNLTTDPGESINLLSGGGSSTMQQKALQLQWIMQYFITTGSSSNAPGDYNGDRVVDANDYDAWRNAYGNTGANMLADGNKNGVVDTADYVIWRRTMQSFVPGAGAGSFGGTQAVPEPSSCALGAMGFILLFSKLARRRRAV